MAEAFEKARTAGFFFFGECECYGSSSATMRPAASLGLH
jgi:hypothetical protein